MIILNHKQTDDLIKHGKTNKQGKVFGGNAFANGTVKDEFLIKSSEFNTADGLKVTVGFSDEVMMAAKDFSFNWDNSTAGGAGGWNAPSNDSYSGYSGDSGSSDSGYSGDSGGSGGGGGDDSGSSDTSFSYEVFDHVERALELLTRATENVAKKLTDYISPLTAKNLLNKQLEKIAAELSGNSKAMKTYSDYAESILHNYKYADKDGNERTVDITSYISESDLRNGNLSSLQYIDTTDEEAKAAVEGANAFLDYLRSAEEAENALLDLANDLGDVYQQLIDLPVENLEKTLDVIANKLDTLKGVSDALSSGETGLYLLQRALAIGAGSISSVSNMREAQRDYSYAVDNVKNARFRYNQLKQQRTDAKADKTQSKADIRKLLKDSNLSSERQQQIRDQLKNGESISKKGIKDENLKQAITLWNKSLKTLSTIGTKITDAKDTLDGLKAAQDDYKDAVRFATDEYKEIGNQFPELKSIMNPNANRTPLYVTQNRFLEDQRKLELKQLRETQKAYDEQQSVTDKVRKDSKSAANQLLKSGKLTNAQKKAIKNGKELDVTNIDASLYRWAVQYNKLLDAEKKEEELKQRLTQQAEEYASNEVERMQQRLTNINEYYQSLVDWEDLLVRRTQTTNDLLESAGGYVKNGTRMARGYQDEMSRLSQQIVNDQKNAAAQLAEINKQVKAGKLEYGSREWREAITAVEELGIKATETRSEIIKLYEEFVNIPVKTAEERIDKLNASHMRLDIYDESGLDDTIQGQQIYARMSESIIGELAEYAKDKYGEVSGVYTGLNTLLQKMAKENVKYAGNYDRRVSARTYESQNELLKREVKNLEQEMNINGEAYAETTNTLNELKKSTEVRSAKSSFNAWSGNILGTRNKDKYKGLFGSLKKIESSEKGRSVYEVISEAVTNKTAIDERDEVISNLLAGNTSMSTEKVKQLKTLITNYNRSLENYAVEQGKIQVAEQAVNESGEKYWNSMTDYIKARSELVTKELSNINKYMEILYNHTRNYANTWASMRDEITEIGWDDRELDSSLSYDDYLGSLNKDYETQMKYLNYYQRQVADSISEQKKLIQESVANGDLIVDSEEYKQAWDTVYNLENQVRSTTAEIDKLYAEMLKNVRFKPIDDAINRVQKLRTNLSALLDLITDDMMFTKDGTYSELGLSNLAGSLNNYNNALEEVQYGINLQKEIQKAYDERRTIKVDVVDKNGETKTIEKLMFSTEEYIEAMDDAQKKTQDALKASQSSRMQIINTITARYKTEIDYLSELIDKRKEALQRQKEMNDYDRSLKKKTNEVQKLEAQTRALDGLIDAESKAQLARKRAELQESRDELEETVEDHIIELREQGLDDLKEELNETYEKFKKDLALNIDSIINTISDTSTNIVGSLGAINQTNEKLLGTFNPELTTDRLGIEKYTRENTSAIPNIDYSKDIAAQLEHYEDNYSKDEITRWRVLQGTENETKENTEDINMSSQEIKENVSETKDLVGNVADSVSSIDDTHKAYSESLKVLGTDFMPTVQDDANKISEDTALLRTKGLENDEQLLENQDFSNDLSTDISTKLDVIDVGVGKLIPIESDLNIMNSYLGNILNAINSIDLTTGKNSPLNLMSSNISAGLIKSSLESGTKSATTAFAAKSKSTPNVNVESLIHVEGNVDEGVVGKIDEIAKGLINNTKFTNNMYSYITKETSKENKKRY